MKSYSIGFRKMGIDLDKVNSRCLTVCPECSEHRKQSNRNKKVFWLSLETGSYKCHHCGIHGRVDSDEWINKQHEKEVMIQPKQTKEIIKPFQFGALSENVIKFLNDRGISKETAEACKVACYKDTLCFNYYKENKVIGAKYRPIRDKKFFQHAGCKKYLYGINDIKNQDEIVIVEGEFDKLALYEAGIKNAVSVSQGAPNVGSDIGTKLQCLDNSIDYIKDAKRVILFCDNDPNGKYLTQILIERFGADRCAKVEHIEGCKDANDVLLKYGKEKLIELVRTAKDTPIAGVRTLNQARSKMMDIFNNGFRKGTETGVRELKGAFSFYKTWWNLWHGIPNSGKTAFVHFIMVCMAVVHGWKWAVFSPEHYPEEDFYIDLVEILTGKKLDNLTENQFEVAMDFIGDHFYFVYPEADEIMNTSDNVLNKIKELKLSKGIDGYLIDPYNQLIRESGENIDRYLERTLSDVDRLDKTHNLVGNIIAHPRTLYKEKDMDDYRKPTPYEIAGGAMWYNKAYGIINIHRTFNQSDKRNPLVEIDIQKIKSHKRAGTPQCVSMNYDYKTGWYCSLNGSCVLDGVFEEMYNMKNEGTQTTFFRDKIEEANNNNHQFTMDDVPF